MTLPKTFQDNPWAVSVSPVRATSRESPTIPNIGELSDTGDDATIYRGDGLIETLEDRVLAAMLAEGVDARMLKEYILPSAAMQPEASTHPCWVVVQAEHSRASWLGVTFTRSPAA